ncbi:polysaccharide deacetylase family protein [Actinoplanes sp. NPDC051851]|uniref:polysaccharide deacetylase family protein n=1 Tax=Actinoplanes sp. NPDC051851 TaxID=3154753 RepID=UPI003442DE91
MRIRVLASLALLGVTGLAGVSSPASAAATCSGYVGLTFDDGPSASNTRSLLTALTGNGLRATMFNEGQYAAAYPALVRAEVSAGMWVGNHSYTHPHMTTLSQADMESEISRTQSAIASAGGGTPRLFRPPYGETNATLQAAEQKYGLTEIIWDVDTQDWNGVSVDAIVAAAATLTNGQIILMHDWPPNTVAAIPRIAQGLASRGLCSGMISPSTGRAVAPSAAGVCSGPERGDHSAPGAGPRSGVDPGRGRARTATSGRQQRT